MFKKQFKFRLYLTLFITLILLASTYQYLPRILGDSVYPLPLEYAKIIVKYSKQFNVPPDLMAGLIFAESGFHKDSISGAGAQGITQMMPGTARSTARSIGYTGPINLTSDPDVAIMLGTAHAAELLNKYKYLGDQNSIKAMLIAYNAGSGVSDAWIESGMRDKYLSRSVLGYANKIIRLRDIYNRLYRTDLGLEPINLKAPDTVRKDPGVTNFWLDLISRTAGLKI